MSSDLIESQIDPTHILSIEDITLTPAFPEPGKELRIDLTGIVKEQVDLTHVMCDLRVRLGTVTDMVTLTKKSLTLPDLLGIWGAELSGDKEIEGPWKQIWIFQLPKEIPRSDYYLDFAMHTEDESKFASIRSHVDFRRK
ncbi:hypothetical protein ACFVZT_23485 [Streptomyces sp. NPDC058321]|uniref:hypothetical protein n=1 Tax=Streptomyces sp. NPDC058321 TaxID=3346445 RepID=UPI0036F0B362